MVPVIGVDVGRTGAMVLLENPDKAIAGVHWKARTRNKRRVYTIRSCILDSSPIRQGHSSEKVVRNGNEIGIFGWDVFRPLIALLGGKMRVSAEDVYMPRRGQAGNIKATITLARFAGAIVGPMERWTPPGEAEWFKAASWRKEVLGLSHFTKREVAKAASLKYLPPMISGLGEIEERLRFDPKNPSNDVTDAGGVARFLFTN